MCKSIARCGNGAIKFCAKSKQWEELLDGKSMVPREHQKAVNAICGRKQEWVMIRREACVVTMVAIL